jgi:multicomponent Na+:H+ antiporter subunit B
MNAHRKLGFNLQIIIALAAVAAVLLPVFLADMPWPTAARDYLEQHGVADSGAINLVSAIYLGYRAFDTLGETLVLLVAVSGAIGIATRVGTDIAKGYENNDATFIIPGEKRRTHAMRTHLLEAVTSKIGPIVLLFGFYVMLYGHLSPGGGFQGGVVIASGIVFLALGSQAGSATRLTRAATLARIEAAAFLLLVLASMSGLVLGKAGSGGSVGGGFFGNPLGVDGPVPPVGFIILLNTVIGLKVGAGIGFLCIAMLGREE